MEHFMDVNQQRSFLGRDSVPCVVVLGLLLSACRPLAFPPAAVVPTQHPLPYSAQIRVVEISVYPVLAGATLTTDPRTRNFIDQTGSVPPLSHDEWKETIVDYVAARQTFRRISTTEPSDLTLAIRVFIYVDPGMDYKFNHTYIAKADASLINPQNGRVMTHYSGLGKRFGPVSHRSMEEDKPMIDQSLQAALNDLFDKIESDTQLASL
jgi:hypothetical protein